MKRLLATAALIGLTSPAFAFDLKEMSDSERAAFRAEVRAYLMDNPEVILEAVDMLESRKAAQQAAHDDALVKKYADELFNDGVSWVGGNPEGDITLVEFMDYRCGYCRRAYEEVEQLIAFDGNIRFIVKEFPILGDASVSSARFAIAAKLIGGDESYKAAHDAMIAYGGDMNPSILKRLAETLNLDGDAILEKMDSQEVTDEIQANRELAQKMQISGTPTFVMQDQMLRGYLPLENMMALLQEKRAN